MRKIKTLSILGTRGVPAAHGGFETFAEKFSLYLVDRGWSVTVYCQSDRPAVHQGRDARIDYWQGVRRVTIDGAHRGPLGTILFDFRAMSHASREGNQLLILGYNTALFNLIARARGAFIAMNMDGIEWKRSKWSRIAKAWLRANEYVGARTAQLLIADHPVIEEHLKTIPRSSPIKMIPYGAERVKSAPTDLLERFGLGVKSYFLTIARIEPENSILEIIEAFELLDSDIKLICLGKLEIEENEYHRKVKAAAGDKVIFPGAIYDKELVAALRQNALAYCHGHTVGGTNPSLVEAMASECAVIAHDNVYNRWVAGPSQLYFESIHECRSAMQAYIHDCKLRRSAKAASLERFAQCFQWGPILDDYRSIFEIIEKPR